MELTLTCLFLLVIWCFVLLFTDLRTFLWSSLIVIPVLTFGPVAYRYFQTGDDSLVWEIVFRAALLVITAWAANEFLRIDGESAKIK